MKKKRNTSAMNCVCTKCGKEAVAPPDTKHRKRKCSSPENGKWVPRG
jgi:hypothetical protein